MLNMKKRLREAKQSRNQSAILKLLAQAKYFGSSGQNMPYELGNLATDLKIRRDVVLKICHDLVRKRVLEEINIEDDIYFRLRGGSDDFSNIQWNVLDTLSNCGVSIQIELKTDLTIEISDGVFNAVLEDLRARDLIDVREKPNEYDFERIISLTSLGIRLMNMRKDSENLRTNIGALIAATNFLA